MNPLDNMFGDGEGLISAWKKDFKAREDKMSIVEKLGITKGPWIPDKDGYINVGHEGYYVAAQVDDAEARAITTVPEMLEGLINTMQVITGVEVGNLNPDMAVKMIKGIIQHRVEEAADKTWTEIKELLEQTE